MTPYQLSSEDAAQVDLAHLLLRRALRVFETPEKVMALLQSGADRTCLSDLDRAIELLGAFEARDHRSPDMPRSTHVMLGMAQGMREFLGSVTGPGAMDVGRLALLMAPIRQLLQHNWEPARLSSVTGAYQDLDPSTMAAQAQSLLDAVELDGGAEIQPLLAGLILLAVAIAFTPPEHPDRFPRLTWLSELYLHIYGRTSDVTAMREAIRIIRCQLAETPALHPERPWLLDALAWELHCLFLHTGKFDALDEALQVACEALAAAPQGTTEWITPTLTLTKIMRLMFLCTGDVSLRDDRRSWLRIAAEEVPVDDPIRVAVLAELGTALCQQAELEGSVELVDEGLRYLREAIANDVRTLPDAEFLADLGAGLTIRYDLTLDLPALEEGIEAMRDAIALTSAWDDRRLDYLDLLSAALHNRFKRQGRLVDLEESVQVARDAVARSPADHAALTDHLTYLAYRLRDLYNATDELGALDESILIARKAIALTPPDLAVRAPRLHLLGAQLRQRFGRDHDRSQLEEAVSVLRQAVAAVSGEDMIRAQCAAELGLGLCQLYILTQDRALLGESRHYLEEAIDRAAPAWLRITSHRALAAVAAELGDGPAALAAMEHALELTEVRALDSLNGADRAHRLGEYDMLAGDVTAVALIAGRPARAVELLERARSVLAADILGLRSGELERLRTSAPDLAEEFERARAQLDSPELAREAQQDLGQIYERIRCLPGLAEFQRPWGIDRLRALARTGPVVLLTTSHAGSTALILTADARTDPVHVVPLPELDMLTARQQAERLWRAGQAAYRDLSPVGGGPGPGGSRQDHDIQDVLAWLWDTVAEPVLSHLEFVRTPRPGEPWPRVWWCPTSVLSYLPLHAAGHRGAPAVLDYVISSYTTTVRALAHPAQARTGIPATLIVPMPDTPGAPLPGVNTETRSLLRLIPDATALLRPTRADVLAALPKHRIAHFACHGNGDRTDPALSRLVLADHATAPLTLSDISNLNLDADLAYLSACDTGIAPIRLTDQSLHFAGAFQLAGYRHVIGTLWSVNDQFAAELAADFYDRLTDGGCLPPRTELSALALHEATRASRARHPDAPALWAAHTHTGL